MKISTKGRYALRIMVDLAMAPAGQYIKVKDIAKRQEISDKYLEQIIGTLNRAGMLRSTRGVNGGYQLSRMPEDYTIEEILRLTEGNLAPVACLEDEVNQCKRAAACASLEVWEGLREQITDYLRSTTLDILAERQKEKLLNLEGGSR